MRVWLDAPRRSASPRRDATTGLGAAIWIHTLAAISWVTFIVGVGLTWGEPELEEEAAQVVNSWRVLTFVTLPHARARVLLSRPTTTPRPTSRHIRHTPSRRPLAEKPCRR